MGSLASFLGNKYQEYDINNKLKAGGSATLKGLTTAGNYLYDLSKPIANKAVEGMGTLYNQMTGNNPNKEEISQIRRENDEEKEEIIRLEEDNEVRDSNLMFKKPDDDKEENQNNPNEIEEDYPTFSKVNNVNGNGNESNISAAPINLKNA